MYKVKVKCTLVQALRFCTAHTGSRGIALFFLDHGTRRGCGVCVTPRPLFTSGKDAVPTVQEAGWAPGPVWTAAQNLAPTGIRFPGRPKLYKSIANLYILRMVSAVRRVEFVSDRLSYIVLRGRWRNIIVVNVHAPREEKRDELKHSYYEELEQVFDHFPKYHMKMLLGNFNAKVRRENIFKPTIGQESLHQDSNDNGVRLINFATSKNLVVKSTMFPHRNIH